MLKKIQAGLEILSAIFGIAAAVLWLWASIESTPNVVADLMKQHGGMDIFGSDLMHLVDGLIEQGRRNALAAKAAAGAAFCQTIAIFLRFLWAKWA